jgi:nicotinamidase/pyrazinamidase
MKALLLIDLQNDFCDKSGALYVPKGEEVVPVANRLMVDGKFDIIVASQDHHPLDHRSFITQHPDKKAGDQIELNGVKQTLWNPHCIFGSAGAAFHKNVLAGKFSVIIRKGTNKEVDSYSAFCDNLKTRTTGLHGYLQELKVDELVIAGVALDYCVKYTVQDAISRGYKVNVVEDGCRAVNLKPDDGTKALEEMVATGAKIVSSETVLKWSKKDQ